MELCLYFQAYVLDLVKRRFLKGEKWGFRARKYFPFLNIIIIAVKTVSKSAAN